MTDEEFQFIFERSKTLKPYRAGYPDKERCYADYARRMTERYAAPREQCDGCASREKLRPLTATWELSYQTRKTIGENVVGILLVFSGSIFLTGASVQFMTRHFLCRTCRRGLFRRRLIMGLLALLATVLTSVAAVALVVTTIYIGVNWALDGKVDASAWTWWCSVLAATLLLILAKRVTEVAEIPRVLRPIGKRPIRLRQLD